jgi:alpha-amylase
MPQICFYFQLHQPWRLKPHQIFEVGQDDKYARKYFDIEEELDFANSRVIKKVAEKSYRPMLSLLLDLVQKHPEFRFSFSASGVFLEQLQEYTPDVIELLQKLIDTKQVEVLSETFYHSLASLYSPKEFAKQVQLHRDLLKKLFHAKPTVFRNTELIYSDTIAKQVANLGYKGMLTEGADKILRGRTPTQLYHSAGKEKLPLLLKHYKLSDDIAFRFSQHSWPEWPLTAEKYLGWLTMPFGQNDLINLFMDFETFGEHQWESEGIFPFFERLIDLLSVHPESEFVTPSQAIVRHKAQESYSCPEPISWADVDRDLTAWKGNSLQEDALRIIYELESEILASGDAQLIEDWRRLQTSDHFYYMCTKWANDGDVHAYFSPYGSPYQAYVNYSMVLADIKMRTGGRDA